MDQNSSNDAEKRNWRERLGIGTKDMPKIAGEFVKPAEPVLVLPTSKSSGGSSDGAPPVVVAKPAPMAPRVAAKPAPARSAPASAPPSSSRPMQPAAPQSPDVLAERLRNQREAAEKLAEQRVNNAKERAEAHKTAAQQQSQPQISPPAQRPQRTAGNKPKFSFAEEDGRASAPPQVRTASPAAQPQQRPGPLTQPVQPQAMQPQIAPARPPLGGGGDRFVNPQPPPSRQGAPSPGGPNFTPPPQYRPQAPGYRPIDPATGYTPPPSFQMPRGTMAPPPGPRPPVMPSGGMQGGLAGDPRLQSGPYIADPYGAPPAPAGGIPRYDQLGRGAPPPLRNDHLRPQTHSYEGDMQDDIFEDAPAAKPRRASQSDYSQAYHPDAEMDYAPRRRSSGPLLLLMLLGVAAAVGIGGVLYYQNMLKAGSNQTADVPVVPSPTEPGKTTAEQPTQPPANGNTAQPSKKQIYDRIVGEREVLGGQMVPTEEVPVQPALDQSTQPAALPQPGAGSSTGGDEPLPLPLPPPVNGNTQGNAGGTSTTPPAATAAADPVPQPATPGTTVTATGYTSEQQQQMAAASQQQTLIEEPAATQDTQAEAVAEPPPAAKPAAKPKAAAKPKPKKKVETASAKKLGDEPVVLVAPEDGTAVTQDPAVTLDGEPALESAAPAQQPVKKKKTLLGLFTGENKRVGEQAQPSGIDAATEQQVASVNTARQATAAKQATQEQPAETSSAAKTGFTLQLASFATEQEARAEYQRIASKHSGTVSGLSPIVSPVSVGGSTRYRLSLGTVSSSTQAQNLCKDLLSSGLRDCSVRRR